MPGDGSEQPAEPDQAGQVRSLIVDELGERLTPLGIGLVVALT